MMDSGPQISFSQIARAASLVDVYSEAHDAYREFQHTGRSEYVQRAAAVLCEGLQRLEHDPVVWEGFENLFRVPLRERERILEVLEDLDTLLTFEAEVLGAEHPLLEEQRNLSYFGGVVSSYRRWPDDSSADKLRNTVSTARQSACRRASWAPNDRPRHRAAPSVQRGLRVAGGLAVAGANATAAASGSNQWEAAASIISGFSIALGARGAL